VDLSEHILFIDDEAIIIDKPAGLPVDTPRRGGDSVVSRAAELRCGKRSSPVPMHRLDQDTSGCLLLARTAQARKMLQKVWEEGPILKHYLAVVDTVVEGESGSIELALAKTSTRDHGWRMVPDAQGQVAITNWWRLEDRDGRTLVRFEPTTGRTHQIRVHAREAFGAGIVGDPIYGSGAGPMMLHASQLFLAREGAGYFDIQATAPLPGHFREWDVDTEAVERDKERLKQEFTYQSVSRDTDKALEDLERPFFERCRREGFGAYWLAEPFVIDCYHEKRALEPLVKMYSGHKYPVGSTLDRILPLLVEDKRADLMEKLWVPITRRSRAAFYAEKPGRLFGDQEWADKAKTHALEAYDDAIEWMARVSAGEVVERLSQEREALRLGCPPELPPVSDLRKMDEAVFWELIRRSRSDGREIPEQIMVLDGLLRTFKAAEIKKFATLYAKAMRELYHWNVWALAYAARGGCSDDSFMEFRTWLILQGDPSLFDLAIKDPAAAAQRVPADPELPDGTLLPVIDEAYYARAGSTFDWPMLDLEQPKGKEWPEDQLGIRFPELVRHYDG
jgi:tRNA pseudouridine32 synthase/23S rRNA pseudouridine746 synthase